MFIVDAVVVLAGIAVFLLLTAAAWYVVGWLVGLSLRIVPLAGREHRKNSVVE